MGPSIDSHIGFETSMLIQSALKFISGETKDVCRLCFAATDEDQLDLHDSIRVQRPYIDVTVTFSSMLLELGVELEPLLPQTLCLACSTTVMNSYLFRHLCEFSNKKWLEAMDKLEGTLQYTDTIKHHAKTLYLNTYDNSNIFTRKPSKSKAEAIKRLKSTISNKAKYQKNKDKKKFICEECGKNFYSTTGLQYHISVQHSSNKLLCPVCQRTFASARQLKDHLEGIHNPKTIPCKQCTQKFGSVKKLKFHEFKYHTAVICKTCFAQIPSRHQLAIHAAEHGKPSCPRCNKTISSTQYLSQHLKICGRILEQQYICDICNKAYAHKNGIHTHMKIHGFGNPLSCNWCEKKFGSISTLKMHIVKHTRERSFFCETCGGKFVTKAALLYHTRLHTGERPYLCEECGERFLSASRRMDHIRRKHLEPSKKCAHCPAKFVAKNQLNKHVRRHFNPQSKLFMPSLQINKVVSLENETYD